MDFLKRGGVILVFSFIFLGLLIIPSASAGFFDFITGMLASDTTSLNISIGNTEPTIDYVSAAPNNSITESGSAVLSFLFNVTDADGVANINRSSAIGSFNKSTEATRTNSTCLNVSEVGNTITFNCSISVWYWDANGNWTINATVKDNFGASVQNVTREMELLLTTGMVMAPTALTWATLAPTSTDSLANENITINNTANKDITDGNVKVTSVNLRGEETETDYLLAANFTVNNTNTCGGTAMVNNSAQGVSGSTITAGNNTAGSGQERLYFCLEEVTAGILQQAYSTVDIQEWTVGVS